MKTTTILLTLLFLCLGATSAQDGFSLKHDSLRSEILDQTRNLAVYLPEGYDSLQNRYPVIYVLDGKGRDQHVVPTARFLFLSEKMPKAIIVGIMNIDRNHDFLPDSTRGTPTGGGADNFIRFFEKELIPFIDKNFRTESYRVLIGHSFGGLFAMHCLLTRPRLFDAYIAIDPSIWYKNLMLLRSAEKEFSAAGDWNKSVYITGREGEGMNEMGIGALEKLMKASAPEGLNWKIVAYADEDHGSVPFKSVYDGLRFIFDAGSALKVFPTSGIVPDGIPFNLYMWNINQDMRFTTDGSEPSNDSPRCQSKLQLTGGCTLKVKNVTRKYKNYPTSTFYFRQENFLEGLKKPGNLKPGLKYEYYEGAWDSLPDFSKLKPVKRGISENVDLGPAMKKDSFAIRFEGYLHITEKDIYYLWIASDDGSELCINNRPILDNDGIHSADLPGVAVVPLTPGYYPITIKYFEKNGNESISAGIVKGEENPSPQPFTKEMLFYKK
jgi:predicted alpha/beta superfamily hydrolase